MGLISSTTVPRETMRKKALGDPEDITTFAKSGKTVGRWVVEAEGGIRRINGAGKKHNKKQT